MAVVSFKVIPVVGERSVSRYVAEAVRVLMEEGLDPIVTPDTTVVSLSDLSALGRIVSRVHERLRSMGVGRVVTIVMVDERFGEERNPMDLVRSVESKLRD